MRTAAIVGASGYVGGELCRLVLGHPELRLTQVTSERLDRRYLYSSHPNLRGQTDLRFRSVDQLEEVDILYLCLPHGKASEEIDRFVELADLVVDCSSDFRLGDADSHTRWYGENGATSPWRGEFVYGLPEIHREELRDAQLISGVGCNATAMNLALFPLALNGLIDRVVAEVKVGSSEGGNSVSRASHHPERAGAVRPFATTGHRHQGEVIQELGISEEDLFFSATSIEMVRGIQAFCHVFLRESTGEREIGKLYRSVYGDEPFIRIIRDRRGLHRYPEPKLLAGSNYCDIGWDMDDHGERLVVVSALDNLMKGAAGSALQSTNIACGYNEKAGLDFPGLHPV